MCGATGFVLGRIKSRFDEARAPSGSRSDLNGGKIFFEWDKESLPVMMWSN